MRGRILGALALGALTAGPVAADVPVSLRGSLGGMERQHSAAVEAGLPFARTPADIAAMEERGELVRLFGNENYGFREGVRSMVGRPELKLFVERLAADYQAACGEKLIVTSMTRAQSRQPRNAHRLSVHPAGIAVDLRVSQNAACRGWLEGTLLAMEGDGLLDGIRERRPPHYHVAIFPDAYMAHMEPILAAERSAERARVLAERLAVHTAGAASVESLTDRGRAGQLLALMLMAAALATMIGRAAGRPAPFAARADRQVSAAGSTPKVSREGADGAGSQGGGADR